MDLPSFIWLWRAAAWAMGFTIVAYGLLAASGLWLGWRSRAAATVTSESQRSPRPPRSPRFPETTDVTSRPQLTQLTQLTESADPSAAEVRRGLRVVHLALGAIILFLVLFLLAIGLVGTWGHFGSLIHSPHFAAGWVVVGLTIAAGISGLRISPDRPRARAIHRTIDVALCVALIIVTYTGWEVVQKYLPPG